MYKARRICALQIQNNFENRFLFPNNLQLVSKRFNETFCGNLVNNFDCRAFSLFETVTGSRIRKGTLQLNLWYAQAVKEFVHYKSAIIFRIHLAIPTEHRIFSLGLKDTFCRSPINISICRCKVSSTHRFCSMLELGLGHFVILETNTIFGIALHF